MANVCRVLRGACNTDTGGAVQEKELGKGDMHGGLSRRGLENRGVLAVQADRGGPCGWV